LTEASIITTLALMSC